ncbi:MAG: hypothetical protein ACRC9K_20380 [Afipia sp.]
MKQLWIALTFAVSIVSNAGWAQTRNSVERLKACSLLEVSERLRCIDKVLQEISHDTPVPELEAPTWVVSETSSPVDYKPQITARMAALAPAPDGPISLDLQCHAGLTAVVVRMSRDWKPVADDNVRVTYRVNDEAPVETRWRSTQTSKGLVFNGDGARLLQSWPDDGRMLFTVFTDGKGREGRFRVTGLNVVRSRIANVCNWPPGLVGTR